MAADCRLPGTAPLACLEACSFVPHPHCCCTAAVAAEIGGLAPRCYFLAGPDEVSCQLGGAMTRTGRMAEVAAAAAA